MPTVGIYLSLLSGESGLSLWLYEDGVVVNTGGDTLTEVDTTGYFTASVGETLDGVYRAVVKRSTVPVFEDWLDTAVSFTVGHPTDSGDLVTTAELTEQLAALANALTQTNSSNPRYQIVYLDSDGATTVVPAEDRGVKLTKTVSPYRYGDDDGTRVRIVASNPNGMPAEVFVYNKMPIVPTDPDDVPYEFSHIASPVDLVEIPVFDPSTTDYPSWFRSDEVDILLPTKEQADTFITDIEAQIYDLIETLTRQQTMEPGGITLIGTPSEDESSLSSSQDSDSGSESIVYGSVQSARFDFTSEMTFRGAGVGAPWLFSPALANVRLYGASRSQQLVIQGLSASIPLNARIDGVVVGVAMVASGRGHDSLSSEDSDSLYSDGGEAPRLVYVGLHVPGRISEDRSEDYALPVGSGAELDFGAADDLWGLEPLTPAEINDGAFGVSLIVAGDPLSADSWIQLQYGVVIVYYSEPV